MKLRSSHPVVRFAFLFDGCRAHTTTLCGLFWRCMRSVLVFSFPLAGLGIGVYAWITNPWRTAIFTGVLVGIVALLAGINELDDRIQQRRIAREYGDLPTKPPSLVREFFYAVKHKVCPLIDIEDR